MKEYKCASCHTLYTGIKCPECGSVVTSEMFNKDELTEIISSSIKEDESIIYTP